MNKTLMLTTLLSSAILVGCDTDSSKSTSSLPLVITQSAEMIDHRGSMTFIGRAEAVDDTNITAQVTGYLQSQHFEEGQMVEEGDLLFTIEPSQFEVKVTTSKAELARADSDLIKAKLDFERGKRLLPKGSISKADFDALSANLRGAQAMVEAATAQVRLAQVNLSYTQIMAPFSGRISDSKASKGDLVSPSSGVLTTLVSLDPIHASFNVSERDRLGIGLETASGNLSANNKDIDVSITLENGTKFEHIGVLDYLGNRINTSTGTIDMRALIPNPEHKLFPGQHVRVELHAENTVQVIAIPRKAVQSDLEGDFVMLVTEGNVIERRNIELGAQTPEGVIVPFGLNGNEQVVVQGLQRIRNGMPVQVQDKQAESTNTAE
ncbi:efflux RND transporter periplasmic adaptor subunit [Vibrio genomosp. F10 str. 9ZC157]|uniref:efflux RND transporter periplasmic adaptor subunit n=1 Tax=Vibrio genomosp. F10 TaxID=723171 RepID=UPI00037E9201|nr:efflux RND transporter periplasmic adaptor subunit [Vibrio genomosp. F10]OEE94492.1 efflux transporter periplasmic adaptor subunit [Vibrio genomosp. F10 str. 9ZC157]